MNDESELLAELIGRLRSPLDPVLTDPTRLRIQAALRALPARGAMSFTTIGKVLTITDGNLGMHLRILADAGFLDKQEHWRGKRRTTLYSLSAAGHAAFEAHVRALETITGASGAPPAASDGTAAGPASPAVTIPVSVPAAGLTAPTQRQQ